VNPTCRPEPGSALVRLVAHHAAPRLPSPFKFNVGVGQVIPGWDQSVKMMHVGEKRRIVVPASLGYGDKGVGPIPGGASLYFEVELLETKPVPEFSQKQLDWLATNPEP